MSTSRLCPHCGADIPPDAPEGLCPRCLAGLAAGRPTEPAAPGADESEGMPAGQFPRFALLGALGRGGMGVVYRARQRDLNRIVALKVISPGMVTDEVLRRFRQEAEALGRLQHPGIARIYEYGTVDTVQGPQPYFVLECIGTEDGEPAPTLTAYADQQGLNTRARLELIERVAAAVHHAHQKGVIHRDLKPANILVDDTGQPKVLDFGVARLTDSDLKAVTVRTDVGKLIGTLPYMSPEQAAGDPGELDTRSDVYALGVIAYELLCGRLPYDLHRRVLHEAVRVIREEEPTRLSALNRTLAGDIETIVLKSLAKEKDRRYQSAAELATDIRRYLRDEPIEARQPSGWYQLRKFAARNQTLVGGIAVIFLVLIAGIAATAIQALRASVAEREAQVQGSIATARAAALDQALTQSKASEEATRASLYQNRLMQTVLHLEAPGNRDARAQLELCPVELRGWEWRALYNHMDQGRWTLQVPPLGARNRYVSDVSALQEIAANEIDLKFSQDGSRILFNSSPWGSGVVDASSGALMSQSQRCAAFSADGRFLIYNDPFRIVDVTTSNLVLEIPEATEFLLHPNGRDVTVLTEDEVSLVDLETFRVRRLPYARHGLKCYSPSGRYLLGRDSTYFVLDAETGGLIADVDLTTTSMHVPSTTWRYQTSWLLEDPLTVAAIAEYGNTAHLTLWDVIEGNVIFRHEIPCEDLKSTAISPSRRSFCLGLLTGATDLDFHIQKTSPRALHFGTRLDSGRMHLNRAVGNPGVFTTIARGAACIALNPGGDEVAVSAWDGTIHRFDLETFAKINPVFRDHGSVVLAMAYSPDGQLLATMDRSGVLKLRNGRPLAAPVDRSSVQGGTQPAQISGSPPVVLLRSTLRQPDRGRLLSVVHTASGHVVSKIVPPGREELLTPDGSTIVVLEQGKVSALDSRTFREKWAYTNDCMLGVPTANRDSTWLIVRFFREQRGQQGFLLFDLDSGRITAEMAFAKTADRLFNSYNRTQAFNPGGSLLAIQPDHNDEFEVYTIDHTNGSIELSFQCLGGWPMQFVSDSRLLFGSGNFSFHRGLDVQSRSWWQFEDCGIVSPDGQMGLFVDRYTYVLGLGSNQLGSVLPALVSKGCKFSPNSALLAIPGARGVEIWQPGSGTRLCTLPSDADTPVACEFSADGRYLTTVSLAGHVQVWDGGEPPGTPDLTPNHNPLARHLPEELDAYSILSQIVKTEGQVPDEERRALLTVLEDRAVQYGLQNRKQEAEMLTRQVLETRMRIQGENHPDTLLAMGSLGFLYLLNDELDKAEQLILTVLRVSEESGSADTDFSENLLILLYSLQGQYEKAARQIVGIAQRVVQHRLALNYELPINDPMVSLPRVLARTEFDYAAKFAFGLHMGPKDRRAAYVWAMQVPDDYPDIASLKRDLAAAMSAGELETARAQAAELRNHIEAALAAISREGAEE